MSERSTGGNGRFTSSTAAEMGRRGAKGRKQRLTLAYVEAALPPLDSLEHAQERLAIVSNWIAAGLLSGTAGHGFVRATEVWLKAQDSLMSKDLVDGLRQRLDELETQLKREHSVL